MKNVTWWKIGLVRTLSMVVLGGALHGVSYNISQHTLFSIKGMSGATSLEFLVISVILFILGFRTERDNEKISKLSNS